MDTDSVNEETKGGLFKLFRRLWVLTEQSRAPQEPLLVTAYFLCLGASFGAFAGPYFISGLMDQALPTRNLDLLLRFGGLFLLSVLLYFACSIFKSFFLVRASGRMFLDLRLRVMASVTRKPASFFGRYEQGDLLTRVSHDTDALDLLFTEFVFWTVAGLSMIVVFLVLMMLWEWRLGFFTILSLPCYVGLLALLRKPLAKAASKARVSLSQQNHTILDLLGGALEIRFFQQSQATDQRFACIAREYSRDNIHSMLLGEWALNGMESFTRLFAALPFMVGGYLICEGSKGISLGMLVAYNLYMAYISATLEVLVAGVGKLSQSEPLIERIQAILNEPEEHIQSAPGVLEPLESTRIEFKDVSFSYTPERHTLQAFNLVIEPGEKVALIGPSGSGKSTIIGLLARQIRPDSGRILLGNRPIDAFPLSVYLQHFAYVRQQPYIFRTSVRDNIAAGWYDVPTEIIEDTARRVHLHEMITRMPQGYDTLLAGNGTDLSHGQRQRLALARALVRGPEILLLDEFTSSLDHHLEEDILNELFLNFKSQTILCVTHSKAVAQRFSRVIELEKL